jgi:hypothetical protein
MEKIILHEMFSMFHIFLGDAILRKSRQVPGIPFI